MAARRLIYADPEIACAVEYYYNTFIGGWQTIHTEVLSYGDDYQWSCNECLRIFAAGIYIEDELSARWSVA